MSNKITLITAFFDLSKIDGSVSKESSKYFELAEYIYKIDCNIVFYVERENYIKVWIGRKKHNLLHKTLIITKTIAELKYFDKYSTARDIMIDNPFTYTKEPEKYKPSYFLFMYNKVEFIDEMIKMNPFRSKYFGWIDFGINHVAKNYDINIALNNLSEKVKICEVSSIPRKEIDTGQYYKIATHYIARTVGGFWLGNRNMMKLFIEKFREWVTIFWDKRLITYDETIYEILLKLNSECVEIYYGRYRYFLDNWLMIKNYDDWYLKNMISCRNNADHHQVVDMFDKLQVYMWKNMKNIDKMNIYDELVISSYYVNKIIYAKYCEEFVTFLENNKDNDKIMRSLLNKKKRIVGNVSFAEINYEARIETITSSNL
jgi:hypothetical protein